MTAMRKTVSWRHPLQWGEPALGFSARLAALNGRSHRAFLREMMVPRRDLELGDRSAIAAIAQIGSADLERLNHFSPIIDRERKMATLGTETLRQLSVRRRRFFYCPHCIQEDLTRYDGPTDARPWLRIDWMVSHVRACNRHNVFLISTPVPDNPIDCFDFAAEIRAILPMLSELCSRSAPAPQSPFQEWIRARLEGKRDITNWLDTMELYAAVDFCEALGLSAQAHLHAPIRSAINLHTTRSRTLSVAELAAAANEGFRIAQSGERSIVEFLSGLAEAQLNFVGPWGLRDTFGRVYELLNTTRDDHAFEQARDVVRRFAIKTIPLPAGYNLLGTILQEQVVHSVRSLAVTTGIHEYTVRNMLENAGMINPDAPALRDHRTTFPLDTVRRLLSDLNGAWTTPRLRKVANIPVFHMRYIVNSGKLPKIIGSEHSRVKTLYSDAAVQDLFAKLFGKAVDVKVPTDRQISPSHARKLTGVAVTDLIDLIYSGDIWTGTLNGKNDYSALLIDADEVLAIVSKGRERGMNHAEVAEAIVGMDEAGVSSFISAGHLTVREQFCPIARRTINIVTRESIDAFRLKYVSPAELARATDKHFRSIRHALTNAGVRPAITRNKSVGTFFLRADVEAFMSTNAAFSLGHPSNAEPTRG